MMENKELALPAMFLVFLLVVFTIWLVFISTLGSQPEMAVEAQGANIGEDIEVISAQPFLVHHKYGVPEGLVEFQYKGMTCIQVSQIGDRQSMMGLSCNWDVWDGE